MIILWLLCVFTGYIAFYLFSLRAWIGEDAFIFFRYIDNFVNGYGLVFNIGERVEGFTSPLWVFSLAFFRVIFAANLRPMAIILGLLLSTFAIFIILFGRRQKDKLFFPIGVILLITNSAFRDFATSGFETSLSYFLTAVSVVLILKKGIYAKPITLSVILSLLVLNRPETVVFWLYILICYVVQLVKNQKSVELLKFLIPGTFLLGGYQIFRLGYFASFFPNTFYAKKGGELYLTQGTHYLLDFAKSYPVTILVLLILTYFLLVYTFNRPLVRNYYSPNYHLLMMALINTSYVLYAGGDYMHGRFLLVPFMLAAISLSDSSESLLAVYAKKENFSELKLTAVMFPLLLLVGVVSYVQKPYSVIAGKQIANIKDERAHFNYNFKSKDFNNYIKEPVTNEFNWAKRGYYYKDIADAVDTPISVVMPNIGLFGYAAGEKINVMGGILTDPYFARFPITKRGTIGHENEVHPEYVLSRKPTFSYTPYKFWNEAAHTKYEQSRYSEVITGDDNDSYIPLFDLSNRTFLEKYKALTGVDTANSIDEAVVKFLSNDLKQYMLSSPQDAIELTGFLKLYWYPYTSVKNQTLFDSTRNKTFGENLLSSFEVFDFYLKSESDVLWHRITSTVTSELFVSNIVYGIKQQLKDTNVIENLTAAVELKNTEHNIEYKLINVKPGYETGSIVFKIDDKKYANLRYTLKLDYRIAQTNNAIYVAYDDTTGSVKKLFEHKVGILGEDQDKITVYIDVTEAVKNTGKFSIVLDRKTGPANFEVGVLSMEVY